MFARHLLLPLLTLGLACAQAQTAPAPEVAGKASTAPSAERGTDQRVEQIQHEDKGSRIEELRVGGETRNITVSPKVGKGTAPAYEVTPESNNRSPATSDGSGEGRARWKVFSY
ncbi:hypothetical protein AZ34_06040 [Hylemonella gracilis str. Niagara R]|uniref:DUF2782 domain-containing protein n=1 Tax=Hylemonella gracilis str. Niagara R TaxID=1458275 RepID=A0A016XHI6_9BURK|nr:hypothetical protein [Hylemonella gracilis]EYC50668.1 hypothetical protein AZ34_06040 [Hylemonella gracilis str. Niagara R]